VAVAESTGQEPGQPKMNEYDKNNINICPREINVMINKKYELRKSMQIYE